MLRLRKFTKRAASFNKQRARALSWDGLSVCKFEQSRENYMKVAPLTTAWLWNADIRPPHRTMREVLPHHYVSSLCRDETLAICLLFVGGNASLVFFPVRKKLQKVHHPRYRLLSREDLGQHTSTAMVIPHRQISETTRISLRLPNDQVQIRAAHESLHKHGTNTNPH